MCDVSHDARTCDYCGLPVGQSGNAELNEPLYCCLGCRFAASVTQEQGDNAQSRWLMTRLGLAVFFTMNIMVMTLALWSWDVFAEQIATGGQRADALFELLRYASLLLTSFVLLLLGGPLIEKCVDDLSSKRLTTDLLLAIGVIAAFVYSAISVLQSGQHTYFEVCAMILVAVTLGRWLEATSKLKTTEVLRDMEKLLPLTFRRIESSSEEEVSIAELKQNDHFRVLPGERIVTDAEVLQGIAAVDEQIITGESLPREISKGDQVLGGSTCLDGELVLLATATAEQGTLNRLIDAVQQAALAKGRWQKVADRLSAWFLPSVLSVALLTLVVHWVLFGFHAGLLASLAVVLIACPCALALATPMAVWVAMTHVAKAGVLLRDGDVIDQLSVCTRIFFDKTGTLSTGQFSVKQVHMADAELSVQQIHSILFATAKCSSHRMSSAIQNYCAAAPELSMQLNENLPGLGIITSDSQNQRYLLGNLRLMQSQQIQIHDQLLSVIDEAEANGLPLVCLAVEQAVICIIVFEEQLREECSDVLNWATDHHYRPEILTGDHAVAAQLFAKLPELKVHAKLLPEQKMEIIHQAQAKGEKVIMVGDGLNDAPSLTAADVGIAMGCGADLSRDAAAVCLLGSDLSKIAWTVSYSKIVAQVVKQNLTWAVSYNVIGIALAALGLLNPILAALAMLISSLIVIGNSLKLANYEIGTQPESIASLEPIEININSEQKVAEIELSEGVPG